MDIANCTHRDIEDWAALRHALWPEEPPARLRAECEAMLALGPERAIGVIARSGTGAPVGFAEATVRRDHVNGCETSPAAFLEGIYVDPSHRRCGIGRALVAEVAQWARTLGLSELGSDALLDNCDSQRFHAAAGFVETERVVFFRRSL